MSNDIITSSVVAKESLAQLENALVMGKLVYRDMESKFGEEKNGATVSIRRPVPVQNPPGQRGQQTGHVRRQSACHCQYSARR